MSFNMTQNQLHTKLSHKYIRGKGIVISTTHLPFQISNNIEINYVDCLDYLQSIDSQQEIPNNVIVNPNNNNSNKKIDTLEDDKFDFCIIYYFLQQVKNPLDEILSLLRILKPGGILYICIPKISNQLNNEKIPIDHFITDFQEANDEKEPSRYNQLFDEKYLKNMFSYILSIKPDSFYIKEFLENEVNGVYENLIILEKNMFCEKTLQILESRSKNSNETDCTLDIIVPIYNAYDDLLKCLYSLVKYQKDYRIVLINDRSTDKRISDLFLQLKRFESSKLILMENKINQGFVGTVNRGMKCSNNDVILLNSDTVVTKGWTEKLTNCAYSDPKISTVTPFTNNGTICSIPNFCVSNEVPIGFTIDSYAEFVEDISFKKYQEIPTAVGFCMYIKREVLAKIGYFDEETFGKGYGEENDFCMRVNNIGYKNVLCDDTFIFHKGEASFLDSTKELVNKNIQILEKRYPEYLSIVADFCQSNPLGDIHEAIKLREKTWDFNNKKRILYILHNYGGGTEKHLFDLIKSLKGYVFYIVQVIEEHLVVTEVNNNSSVKYNFRLSERINFMKFYNEYYRKILEQLINTFKINLIHVQHLIGHPLDVFDVAQKYNIPLLITIHDFYTVCPRVYLLDENNKYCHKWNNPEKCSHCLMETIGLPSDYISHWRNNFIDAFKKCNMIIVPSDSVIKILHKYYPGIERKYSIISHGHSEELFNSNNIKFFNESKKMFNIAYIGVLAQQKGRDIFYKLASSEELRGIVKWKVFGTSDIQVEYGYNKTQNIHYYGKYENFDHLKKLVNDEEIDLVILPAIWPETFSYTLSEAWALGIPVLVSNLGALNERVKMNGGGWIVDINNVDNVNKLIKYIKDNPSEYLEKKKEVELIYLKTFQNMASEYKNIYEKFINTSKIKREYQNLFSNSEIFSAIYMPDNVKNNLEVVKQRNQKLHERFFLCLEQNGFKYTMKKLSIYFFTHLRLMIIRDALPPFP